MVKKIGIVTSNKMEKTIVITVENKYAHSRYNKILKKTKRFMALADGNEYGIGDTVMITETKPSSKKKHWKVIQKIKSPNLII